MAASKKFTNEGIPVSPKEALDIVQNHKFHRQRALRPAHVKSLAGIMKRGHFREGSSIEFGVLPTSEYYLCDGQHRLHAVIEADLTQHFTVIRHQCRSMTEVEALYATFDRGLRRTPTDMMNAHGLREDLAISYELFQAMHGASALATFGFMGDLRGPSHAPRFSLLNDEEWRAELVRFWKPEAEQYWADIEGGEKFVQRFISRIGVLALALVTYRHAPQQATSFWHGLAMDDGLTRDDARKALLHYMVGYNSQKAPPHILARTATRAWNAWMTKTLRRKIHSNKAPGPMRIQGTPHRGKNLMVYFTLDGTLLKDPISLENMLAQGEKASA